MMEIFVMTLPVLSRAKSLTVTSQLAYLWLVGMQSFWNWIKLDYYIPKWACHSHVWNANYALHKLGSVKHIVWSCFWLLPNGISSWIWVRISLMRIKVIKDHNCVVFFAFVSFIETDCNNLSRCWHSRNSEMHRYYCVWVHCLFCL